MIGGVTPHTLGYAANCGSWSSSVWTTVHFVAGGSRFTMVWMKKSTCILYVGSSTQKAFVESLSLDRD